MGRLTVLSERSVRGGHPVFTVRCDCGTEKEIAKQSVLTGRSRSCGCLNDEVRRSKPRTHGMSRTRTHRIWCGLVKRCVNPNEPAYAMYGARGIKVCRPWRQFKNFLADMGVCPDGMSLDRIDNDGHYEPSNCRWATRAQQARNTRSTIHVTVGSETLCLKDWADRLGRKPSALYAAHRRGNNLVAYIEAAAKGEA